jgi:ATP-dependent helicase HrpA
VTADHAEETGRVDELEQEVASLRAELAELRTQFRAASEATGRDLPEEAFRRDAIAAYLRATIRIVDARGAVLGQGREVDSPART